MVPPPRTVIWSSSLTRPSIFSASKNLALSPPAPLPGMPSLSPGPCILAVSEPLAAAADAGGAIVLPRTGRGKDECDASGGALLWAQGLWGLGEHPTEPPGGLSPPSLLLSCPSLPSSPRHHLLNRLPPPTPPSPASGSGWAERAVAVEYACGLRGVSPASSERRLCAAWRGLSLPRQPGGGDVG